MTTVPESWDDHYRNLETPWDLGGPHPRLLEALDGPLAPPAGGTALVPGCGRGYDAEALALAGWTTLGVDLAPHALEFAALNHPTARFAEGNALDPLWVLEQLDGQVDLLWDHTFFCALSPVLRPAFGDLCRTVVRPGGRVASAVFPIGREAADGGPPYGMRPEDLDEVLEGFDRVSLGPVLQMEGRPWPHRLGLWART